jgi:hypothetical protein
MTDYVVVANQTLGGDQLLAELQRRLAEGPCHFHIVAPANVDPEGWTHDVDRAWPLARERLDAAIERFGALGAEVDGPGGRRTAARRNARCTASLAV